MSAGLILGRPQLRIALATAAALALTLVLAAFAAPSANAAPAVGTFQTLTSSPVALTSVTVDPTTNTVYAQGNENTTFYKYDPTTNVWTTLAPAPLNSGNNGGAAYLGGKIYTVYTGNSNELGVYDIASNTWTTIPNPLGLGTGNITAVGGLLYLVEATSFVSYNPATDTTTTLADAPTFPAEPDVGCDPGGFQPWGAIAPYQGKIYGQQGNGCEGFASYDIATNTWTVLTSVPGGTTDTGATVLGGTINPLTGTFYTYGGYGGTNWNEYNIAAGTWTTVTLPFTDTDDGGMAYVSTPGLEGVYLIEGQENTGFFRFVTPGASKLSITKTASVTKATVGDAFSYSIKVTNGGPDTALATKVTDPLPSDVSFVSSSTTAGSCSGTTTVTCNLGDLANGASATITINVKATAAGSAGNTATVSTTSVNTSASSSSTAAVTITAVVPPAPKPKRLKLSVSPGSVVAGTHKCFAFHATSSGKGVGGVTVKFAGKKAHTSSKGKAKVCVTFTKKGTHRASASKKGYTTAHASVRVKPKPAKKPVTFTG